MIKQYLSDNCKLHVHADGGCNINTAIQFKYNSVFEVKIYTHGHY